VLIVASSKVAQASAHGSEAAVISAVTRNGTVQRFNEADAMNRAGYDAIEKARTAQWQWL
jgi:hypothetical protein